MKHGGRVEVPAHPHNIKRLLSGAVSREAVAQNDAIENRDSWDAMTAAEKRELCSVVSERVLCSPDRLYQAAQVWMAVKDAGHPAYKRFLNEFSNNK